MGYGSSAERVWRIYSCGASLCNDARCGASLNQSVGNRILAGYLIQVIIYVIDPGSNNIWEP